MQGGRRLIFIFYCRSVIGLLRVSHILHYICLSFWADLIYDDKHTPRYRSLIYCCVKSIKHNIHALEHHGGRTDLGIKHQRLAPKKRKKEKVHASASLCLCFCHCVGHISQSALATLLLISRYLLLAQNRIWSKSISCLVLSALDSEHTSCHIGSLFDFPLSYCCCWTLHFGWKKH